MKAYSLSSEKCFLIENYFGPKLSSAAPEEKTFVSGTRPLQWKNREILRQAFALAKQERPEVMLDEEVMPYEKFVEKISCSYGVILVSLGDISPNMILDALRTNTPFILTRENGLMPRIKDIGLFVDPKDPQDIKEKILFLADEKNREGYRRKLELFQFTHTWEEICGEFIKVYTHICA